MVTPLYRLPEMRTDLQFSVGVGDGVSVGDGTGDWDAVGDGVGIGGGVGKIQSFSSAST